MSVEHPLPDISRHLAEIVARCASSAVAVSGRGRRTCSGFVWRPGVIVTASDALERDEDIGVLTSEGQRLPASLAGRDPTTDVAVLKVAEAQSPLLAARADEMSVGELALVIGRNREGATASLNMLASVGGPWESLRGGRIDRNIRLDRAVHPAQEGGIVVNASGNFIGMAVPGPRRAGLVIPLATIERVAEQILTRGRVARGYLGLGLQPVRLDEPHASSGGLIVVSVDPDGPGRRAGVLVGDVITAWNREPVRSVRDVFSRLGSDVVGRRVDLAIVRAGQNASASVEISERPIPGA